MLPISLGNAGVEFLWTHWSSSSMLWQAYILGHILLPWRISASLPEPLRKEQSPDSCVELAGLFSYLLPQLHTEEGGALHVLLQLTHYFTLLVRILLIQWAVKTSTGQKRGRQCKELWLICLDSYPFCQRRKWQPIPIFLPGEISWTEEPGEL